MPLNNLSQLHVGKVDGKHEFLESGNSADIFFDAFLVPDAIDPDDFLRGDVFIVKGFRGTGKTSLLRYLARLLRDGGAEGQFVLFKSGLSESQRMEISKQAGISWEDVDSNKIQLSQDFKESWIWFLHKKIGELLKANESLASNPSARQTYLEMLGLVEKAWFDRVLGGFPKLEASKIKIRFRIPPIDALLEGKGIKGASDKTIALAEVVHILDALLKDIGLTRVLYVYLDELEVFYHTADQYKRDLRMIRDLVFAANHFVDLSIQHSIGIRLCVAIRSEVLDALGSEGQEISKLVQDRGVNVAWHYSTRNLNHPLLNMVRKKIWASELARKLEKSEDPISTYFPSSVNGKHLDAFLLDQSFYKPRDLVWRLSIAKQQFPNSAVFTEQIFAATEFDYSAKLWEEIVYELGAIYSPDEISYIEKIFLGAPMRFSLMDVETIVRNRKGPISDRMFKRRSLKVLLEDLYRLGAIGNNFKVSSGPGEYRNRWIFRGDATLLLDKRMELHSALAKRLSAVKSKGN